MKRWLILMLMLLALLASGVLSLAIGSASLTIAEVWQALLGSHQNPLASTIVWQVRLPRLLCAMLVGAGLAVAGAVLQNASRHPALPAFYCRPIC